MPSRSPRAAIRAGAILPPPRRVRLGSSRVRLPPRRSPRGRGRRSRDRRADAPAGGSPSLSAAMRAGEVFKACCSVGLRRLRGSEPAPVAAPRRPACAGLGCRLDLRQRGHAVAALRQHVGIAAGIFDPAALALGAITEVTVRSRKSRSWLTSMHRAGIVGEHLLQQVERFEVEVVGRLVEHQQVGRAAPRRAPASAGRARRPTARPACAPARA